MNESIKISKIIIPTKLQNDSIAAIFLLKHYGEINFPGIKKAPIEIVSQLNESSEELEKKGILLIDIGEGKFDHHKFQEKKTTTSLIAEYLGIKENKEFQMWFSFVERCEFFGKAVISNDPLDKAFGLAGLLVNLNNFYENDPNKVYGAIEPILEAHVKEQYIRTVEIPKIFQEKTDKGEVLFFDVNQHGKKINVVMIESDNVSISGYLRSKNGGNYNVVVLRLPSGHVNIITKNIEKIDLSALAAVLRKSEALVSGKEVTSDFKILSQHGRMVEIPEWYYDPATNSIQNGGINPSGTNPTKISWTDMKRIVEAGLSQHL
ncbi:MAG: hypothetical protein WCV55_00800 [Candidatus Paceibacterota bacterium]